MSERFVAWARVSSREQQREGFSLGVQEQASVQYAERVGGVIVKSFIVAETATRPEERKHFRQMLAYVRKHAKEITGVLYYKQDRAMRNMVDCVEMERLELEFGISLVCITQPTDDTPAGRFVRRVLVSKAAFDTEQQSLDVREGMERRVKSGLFVGWAPYGWKNVRKDDRGLVEEVPEKLTLVRRAFELYAWHHMTIDQVIDALEREGHVYLPSKPRVPRSKLHEMLQDRSYVGEVRYHGQWYPGGHSPVVAWETFDRVQALLGNKVYKHHKLTYAGSLVRCGYCERFVTGEKIAKKNGKEYVYYRCAQYNTEGHPRVRLTEADLDGQALALFDRFRIPDERLRTWFSKVLHAVTRDKQKLVAERRPQLTKQLTSVTQQMDRLLNLRLCEEIESETFNKKQTELQDRAAKLKLEIDALDRGKDEHVDTALKAFELSQALKDKWLTADYDAKRMILEIVALNWMLEGVSLVPTLRKPFDVLAEAMILKDGRGDWI